jgi:hypothetical protein
MARERKRYLRGVAHLGTRREACLRKAPPFILASVDSMAAGSGECRGRLRRFVIGRSAVIVRFFWGASPLAGRRLAHRPVCLAAVKQ